MWWKIALLVLVVGAIAFAGYMYIKSLKEFKQITAALSKPDEENNTENETEE